MSLPPINPQKSAAGIVVDPKTLEKVVPVSRRPDGTLRKELKIRPGFTPQEDVTRYKTARSMTPTLPPGSISSSSKPKDTKDPYEGMTPAQKKNAKRKEAKKAVALSGDGGSWRESPAKDEDEEEEKFVPKVPTAAGNGSGSSTPKRPIAGKMKGWESSEEEEVETVKVPPPESAEQKLAREEAEAKRKTEALRKSRSRPGQDGGVDDLAARIKKQLGL